MRILFVLSCLIGFLKIGAASDVARVAEIIVTASPISIDKVDTKITKENLERKKQNMVTEVLRTAPGLQVIQYGLGRLATIHIRGANSDHTAVRIDGMNVGDPTSANGAYNFAHLLTHGIDQIQILRGPWSSRYGEGAIGGVIDVQTLKGKGPMNIVLQGSEGSFTTTTGSFNMQGEQGRGNYHVALGHLRSRGFRSIPQRYRAQIMGPQRDPYENSTLVSRLGVDFNDTFRMSLFTRGVGIDSRYNDEFSPNPFAREKSLHQFHRLQADIDLYNRRWQQSVGVSTNIINRREMNAQQPFIQNSCHRGGRTQVDWKHTINMSRDHRLWGSLEAEESRLVLMDSQGLFQAHTQDMAMSLVQYSTFFNRLTLQGGGRLHHSSRFKTIIPYHLAATYHHLESDTKFETRYGTSFKAPSLYQLYGRTGQFLGNPLLKPEISSGWEVGIKQGFLRHQLSVGSTYFHNNVSRLIVFSLAPPFRNMNLDKVLIFGFESFISYNFSNPLSIRLDHTYTRTRDRLTRQDLRRRPRHKFSVQVDYDVTEKWQVGVSTVYCGKWIDADRRTFARVQTKPYLTTTLTTSYNLNTTWQCYGKISNLFNSEYEEPFGFLQPGINFLVGIKATVL